MMVQEKHVEHEVDIVWERDDIEDLGYVREKMCKAGTRTRPVPWRGYGERVGYAVLADDAPNAGSPGRYDRRLFFLKPHDGPENDPVEAVDPQTVAPGIAGERPEESHEWNVELEVEG